MIDLLTCLFLLFYYVCVQASTQTDAMRVPAPRRRQMKNKSVLCRPFTMDQESYCQLSEPSTESAGNYKTTAEQFLGGSVVTQDTDQLHGRTASHTAAS